MQKTRVSWSLKWRLGLILIAVIFVTSQFLTKALPDISPPPKNGFSFAALGDAPYGILDEQQYGFVLNHIANHDLAFVVHIGDMIGFNCSDSQYQSRLDWFNALPHPVLYTPGDNEWSDCRGFDRYERLNRLRQMFYSDPGSSLGAKKLAVLSQSDSPEKEKQRYIENQMWFVDKVVFASVHLVGSRNGSSAGAPKEVQERTQMASAWMQKAFSNAIQKNAKALVLSFHANPRFSPYYSSRYYQPFLSDLAEQAVQFKKPILLIHGDHHEYIVDHPVFDRVSGNRLMNVTRLQVPGSPNVGWVKVDVINTDQGEVNFSFQKSVVPHWKYF